MKKPTRVDFSKGQEEFGQPTPRSINNMKTKKQIKREFYAVIRTLWKEPKADVFYFQRYLYGWVEELLELEIHKAKEEVRLKERDDAEEEMKRQKKDLLKKVEKELEHFNEYCVKHSADFKKIKKLVLGNLKKSL